MTMVACSGEGGRALGNDRNGTGAILSSTTILFFEMKTSNCRVQSFSETSEDCFFSCCNVDTIQ